MVLRLFLLGAVLIGAAPGEVRYLLFRVVWSTEFALLMLCMAAAAPLGMWLSERDYDHSPAAVDPPRPPERIGS